ncbi:hypothetical protein C1646_816593 [Rhizophagus diaphanus]|nr:hypothetical protein C1646_816593 [Rhizophagus diaphanus] [Rhizophagus sp. MUCL 43196]
MPAQLSTILYISEYRKKTSEFIHQDFHSGNILLTIGNIVDPMSPDAQDLKLILTTATILPIKPEDLPIHQINVVGTASVSDSVLTTNLGIQFECIISDNNGSSIFFQRGPGLLHHHYHHHHHHIR